MNRQVLWIGLLTLSAATGCGSGMEPLSALNQQGPLPPLTLPVADLQIVTVLPFSLSGAGTTRDGFDLTTIASQSVVSPASGVVSFVDTTAGAGIVTIIHSLHLVSRLS